MQYLAVWRMHMAAQSLREGHRSVAQVGASIGYESERRLVGPSSANSVLRRELAKGVLIVGMTHLERQGILVPICELN